MRILVLTFYFLLSSGLAKGQNEVIIETNDIDNFWKAYDDLKHASDRTDSINVIQTKYIDQASSYFKEFIRIRNFTADEYRSLISKYPKFWISIRPQTEAVKGRRNEILALLNKYEKEFPNFRKPNICFAIGCLRTGGTISENLVLIGTEITAATSATERSELSPWLKSIMGSTGDILSMISHEIIHTQQRGGSLRNLAEFAISEGVADFLSEKISGFNINKISYKYGIENDCMLRKQFLSDYLQNKNDISKWLFNGNKSNDRPADLGYYIGYQIAKEYYLKTADKKKAIIDLLNRKNYKKIFKKSDYINKVCD